MEDKQIPIFVFNGLLESGKTVMIQRFLKNPQICDGKKILLILCEEGIEEYDEDFLKERNTTVVSFEEESDFTNAALEEIHRKHMPDVVVIEYNGMWKGLLPVEMRYPKEWQLVEVMTTVDASTFDSYSKNMRAIMVAQYKITDIVVFNRFNDTMDKIAYRSLIKAASINAQVVFEYEDGRIDTAFDASPFDLSQDEITVDDNDFGVFYFDVMDHADKYDGKTVCLRAMLVKLAGTKLPGFLAGRFAMTCCENDIQFISIYCKNNIKFKNKAWYHIEAKVVCVDASVYGEPSGEVLPALEVVSVKPASKPEQEIVTF